MFFLTNNVENERPFFSLLFLIFPNLYQVLFYHSNENSSNNILIKYELTYKLDSLNTLTKKEIMLLNIDKNLSLFESLFSHNIDSITNEPDFTQASIDAIIPYLKTNYTYKIYKNHTNNTTSLYEKLNDKIYNVTQINNNMTWKLTNEKK